MRPTAWPSGWYVLSPHQFPKWNDRAEPRPQAPFASGTLLPNLTDWQLGDILLYAPDSYAAHQHLISSAQRIHFAREHACWTHCALYVGSGYIVDSVGKSGVGRRSIETLTSDGHVRVRRLKSIRAADQQDLAQAANAWVGTGYSRFKAAIAALAPYFPQVTPFIAGQLNGSEELLYCAELVEAVYVAKLNVAVCNTGLPLPAAFSADTQFADVPVGWRVAV